MRHTTWNILIVAFTAALVPVASLAQNMSPCGVTAQGINVYPSYAKTNPPFSATIQNTHEQQLADGNAIHGEIVTHYYRDSTGRTRNESSVMCGFGLDGNLRPIINVVINDPANHKLAYRRLGQDCPRRPPGGASAAHRTAYGPAANPGAARPQCRHPAA